MALNTSKCNHLMPLHFKWLVCDFRYGSECYLLRTCVQWRIPFRRPGKQGSLPWLPLITTSRLVRVRRSCYQLCVIWPPTRTKAYETRPVAVSSFNNCNSLFTPPTRTRQDCLVLSVLAVWTQLQIRQDSFVLSRPSFQFVTVQSQIYWGLLKTWKLETGSTL